MPMPKDRRPLTQALLKERLHYDPETGHFTSLRNWARVRKGDIAGSLDSKGYRQIVINQKFYYAHRLAFLYMTGAFPDPEADHRNGRRDDNRWKNLREATPMQNVANRPSRNSTGFKGVRREGRKFVAQISINGKNTRIGSYDTPEEAGRAYEDRAKIHFGEFINVETS